MDRITDEEIKNYIEIDKIFTKSEVKMDFNTIKSILKSRGYDIEEELTNLEIARKLFNQIENSGIYGIKGKDKIIEDMKNLYEKAIEELQAKKEYVTKLCDTCRYEYKED